MSKKDNFLYPNFPYRGNWTPETLAFNANLQEFSYQINYFSNLATNNKLTLDEAYQKIENLFEQLENSINSLRIDKSSKE